jgi:hypothetical protein
MFRLQKQQTYDEHVSEALSDVKSGQHLRFINQIYKTKEVCLAAVKYESRHTSMLNDFYSVPMGNLDYVTQNMREIKKNNVYYLEQLEKAFIERKKTEQEPGYYGDFKTYQDMLDHYGVTTYDDMQRMIGEKIIELESNRESK